MKVTKWKPVSFIWKVRGKANDKYTLLFFSFLVEEYANISAYIRQLVLSPDLKEFSRLCDYEMLNSILCRYMQRCTDSHISFHADIRSGTTDFIADNDFTSLFCNLLDNAITVINSCRKNPFLCKGRQLTVNKNGHGFGLKSIRKAVSKYHGNLQMYYNDDMLTFHTIITLKH